MSFVIEARSGEVIRRAAPGRAAAGGVIPPKGLDFRPNGGNSSANA
jgi:hypothetical protein